MCEGFFSQWSGSRRAQTPVASPRRAGSRSPSVVTAYVNGPGLAGAAGRLGAEDVLCLMP